MVNKKVIGYGLLAIMGFSMFSVILFMPHASLIDRKHKMANVLLFTTEKETALTRSLKIDEEAIDLTLLTSDGMSDFDEDLLKDIDVIIIDRYMPEKTEDLILLRRYINGTTDNLGLIMFGVFLNDEEKDNDFSDSQINAISDLLPVSLSSDTETSTNETSEANYKIQAALEPDIEQEKAENREESHILVRDIAWTSGPLISRRLVVEAKSDATIIVESIDGEYTVLAERKLDDEGGLVIFYSMIVNGKNEADKQFNGPFVLWPYFNYLMYVSVFHVHPDFQDSDIQSYAQWPYSPIPHLTEIIMWFSMIAVLWVITFYWFVKMRKKNIPQDSKLRDVVPVENSEKSQESES